MEIGFPHIKTWIALENLLHWFPSNENSALQQTLTSQQRCGFWKQARKSNFLYVWWTHMIKTMYLSSTLEEVQLVLDMKQKIRKKSFYLIRPCSEKCRDMIKECRICNMVHLKFVDPLHFSICYDLLNNFFKLFSIYPSPWPFGKNNLLDK